MLEFISIIIFIAFVGLHFSFIKRNELHVYYLPALFVKILAGWSVGFIYLHYYSGGDTWNYFNQANILANSAFKSWSDFIAIFWKSNYQSTPYFIYVHQPRAAFFTKLVALVNVLTHKNYWLTSMFFSWVGFMGLFSFAQWVSTTFTYGKITALAILFWPGIVFWSAGILKETLAITLIYGLWVYYFNSRHHNVLKWLVLAIGFYLLFSIKYYFASVWAVVLMAHFSIEKMNWSKKSTAALLLTWLIFLMVGFLLAGMLHYNLSIANVFQVIHTNNQLFLQKSSAASAIHFLEIHPPWLWMFINSPKALLAAVYMPLSLQKNNLFFSLYALQNWVLLLFSLRAVYEQWLSKNKVLKDPLFLTGTIYTLILAIFLALSTPNIGTLVRYSVSFMPVVITLVFLGNRLKLYRKQHPKS